jgi:hypothetical protein
MSSANFTQISGPGGRVQTLVPGAGPQTFIWNPASLKGQLDGGDFIYAKRFKVRTTGFVTPADGTTRPTPPNWEIIASSLGNVRAYSQFLGEVVPKTLNSVPLLSNHDQYFVNGFRPITRKRGQASVGTTVASPVEFVFEIPMEREYLTRPSDSCPWLPFFEGGIIEVDLGPTTSLSNWGFTTTGNCQQTLTADWYVDKQAMIHSPIQSRLYKVVTTGPEYVLKSVGSAQGYDGLAPGCRLALLSWLFQPTGSGTNSLVADSGYYTYFGGGGIDIGTAVLTRMDIPFRNQVSIDDVSAWIETFLSDTNPVRMFENLTPTPPRTNQNDIAQWPYEMESSLSSGAAAQSLFTGTAGHALNFWPLIWPSLNEKISDMQKVNGDLSFTATLTTPPGSSVQHLFRTDEVCSFTMVKVQDMMQRMGLPHKEQGGAYDIVAKYADPKRADPTTRWGFPLKIVHVG